LIELPKSHFSSEASPSAIVSPEALDQINHMVKEHGFQEALAIRTQEIVTARWVGLKCRYGCANYNTNWCCPPAAPNLEATRELLSEYSIALLLLGRATNEHFYRNSTEKRRRQIRQWKGTVSLERKLFLMGYYKAFGLPSESCALCKKCSYPGRCKFPNEKRPSVEACSIDVLETTMRLGRSVQLATSVKDSYNTFSLILLV
jgi:predicted metal-binding protein